MQDRESQPVDHEKQAREIVDDLIAADSHVYIPQSLYEPFVARITTALQSSAGVEAGETENSMKGGDADERPSH